MFQIFYYYIFFFNLESAIQMLFGSMLLHNYLYVKYLVSCM